MDEDRLAKLPKWARDEITLQARRVADLQKRVELLTDGNPGSPVVARPYGGPPQTLDPKDVIRFRVGGQHSDYIDVRFVSGNSVEVSAGRQLVIEPRITNIIVVRSAP